MSILDHRVVDVDGIKVHVNKSYGGDVTEQGMDEIRGFIEMYKNKYPKKE